MGSTTRKTSKRRRPRADFTPEQRAAYGARKRADKQTAIAAREGAAALLAQRPALIDPFRVYASRVMGHRTLGNALGMMAQNPSATRVNSAFFWAKEGRAVLPGAAPICVLARRKGNKIVEEENPDTGETEETVQGKWSGWTAERVFDVRDTIPAKKPCQHCGTEPGGTCPASCAVYEPVAGPVPTREEVAELLDTILREEGGFDLDFLEAAADEAQDLLDDEPDDGGDE
ncbi:hypothetical protein GBF35_25570 [Nonomuraea phyllanthi]|uniref:hypothetical protein n=1 Tax=Nonomuraea phyllanthi TaxID=2219224 RepID=UPI001293AA15|nr:hypothetical protein [Nonomuraea phyllanthi]QFY09570.1 hypothetical protein GBF35_25570 [Nonomuraea phyllanthi]